MRAPRELADDPLHQLARDWADEKVTLRQVRGYTDEELDAIVRAAQVFFRQGRIEEARVLFRGLRAVDPLEPSFARGLAVVEFAADDPDASLAAWDAAIALAPGEPSAWIGRAEVEIACGDEAHAVADLRHAQTLMPGGHPLRPKLEALLVALSAR